MSLYRHDRSGMSTRYVRTRHQTSNMRSGPMHGGGPKLSLSLSLHRVGVVGLLQLYCYMK